VTRRLGTKSFQCKIGHFCNIRSQDISVTTACETKANSTNVVASYKNHLRISADIYCKVMCKIHVQITAVTVWQRHTTN